MRIEDIRACEAILRDAPKMKLSLAAMEREAVGGITLDERVQHSAPIPTAVRLSENKFRSGIIETIETIDKAVNKLDKQMRDIVISVYFLGQRQEDAAMQYSMNRRTVTRRCREAIEKIAPHVLPMYGYVIKWREQYDRDIVLAWTYQK